MDGEDGRHPLSGKFFREPPQPSEVPNYIDPIDCNGAVVVHQADVFHPTHDDHAAASGRHLEPTVVEVCFKSASEEIVIIVGHPRRSELGTGLCTRVYRPNRSAPNRSRSLRTLGGPFRASRTGRRNASAQVSG
jgi:hypothetical protein